MPIYGDSYGGLQSAILADREARNRDLFNAMQAQRQREQFAQELELRKTAQDEQIRQFGENLAFNKDQASERRLQYDNEFNQREAKFIADENELQWNRDAYEKSQRPENRPPSPDERKLNFSTAEALASDGRILSPDDIRKQVPGLAKASDDELQPWVLKSHEIILKKQGLRGEQQDIMDSVAVMNRVRALTAPAQYQNPSRTRLNPLNWFVKGSPDQSWQGDAKTKLNRVERRLLPYYAPDSKTAILNTDPTTGQPVMDPLPMNVTNAPSRRSLNIPGNAATNAPGAAAQTIPLEVIKAAGDRMVADSKLGKVNSLEVARSYIPPGTVGVTDEMLMPHVVESVAISKANPPTQSSSSGFSGQVHVRLSNGREFFATPQAATALLQRDPQAIVLGAPSFSQQQDGMAAPRAYAPQF